MVGECTNSFDKEWKRLLRSAEKLIVNYKIKWVNNEMLLIKKKLALWSLNVIKIFLDIWVLELETLIYKRGIE